jgi:hypothetical protein
MMLACPELAAYLTEKIEHYIDFRHFAGSKFIYKLIFLSIIFLNYDTFLRQIVLLHHKFFIFANDLNF